MVRNHNLLLYLTIFFRHADVGSCFPSAPVLSRVRGPCTSLADISNAGTSDYADDNIWDSHPFTTSEWASATDDMILPTTDYNEVNNRDDEMSEEDIWIQNVVDEIHNDYSTLDEDVDRSIEDSIRNTMDNEIAMLVRCNERPEELLIEEGRALPPLTEEEKNDVFQLVVWNEDTFEATEFLKHAVSEMFREHAVPSVHDGILSMDRANIASWMTKSLREEDKHKVSQHDKRVIKTMADFSEYGSGRLVEENFQNLYLRCIVGDSSKMPSVSAKRHLEMRKKFRDAVWRDIRAHGMLSPIEAERLRQLDNLEAKYSGSTLQGYVNSNEETVQGFVDECEILDWDLDQDGQNYSRASSHKLVEMADDQLTPLRIRDGNFIFIDEESCIGCRKCVDIAPSSFLMMESGRARTYIQRVGGDVKQAVNVCPVSCMHRVSFQELSAFETARDKGRDEEDGKPDHNDFLRDGGHIPLHVAGMDSDRNRRSSWYHTLKHRCLMSSDCPKKGCYDCPHYHNPGQNPFFIARHKHAEHIRAQHFIKNGDARFFRKAVDL